MTFKTRLKLFFSLLIALSFTAMAAVIWKQQSDFIESERLLLCETIANGLSAASLKSLMTFDHITLNILARQSAAVFKDAIVVILDREGRIAGHSAEPSRVGEKATTALRSSVLGQDSEAIRLEDGRPAIRKSTPVVSDNGGVWGAVIVTLNAETAADQLAALGFTVIFFATTSIVAGVAISRSVIERVCQPLKSFASAADRVASGDFELRVVAHDGDEIAGLADSFNAMVRELKLRDARIRQGERLATLGVLAASIAHEIRNPLTSIKVFMEGIPSKIDKPGFLEKYQARVPSGIRRIERILTGLLDLARKEEVQMEAFTLRQLAEAAIALIEDQAEAKGVRIDTRFVATEPEALFDFDLMLQAVHNLAANALQATPEGGRLIFGTETEIGENGRKSVSLKLRDTGCGMDTKVLDKIFDPFFTTRKGEQGTGLGLAIAQKIVVENGGKLTVQSALGEGSEFTIRLPAAPSVSPALC